MAIKKKATAEKKNVPATTGNGGALAQKRSELAKSQGREVAGVQAEAFEMYAGAGRENITKNDVLIPRIGILQALSPQLKKSKPEYIDGAKVGEICDIGKGEVIGEKLIFLPVYYHKVWMEWAPRETNKGLITIHVDDHILKKCRKTDKGQWFHGENEVIETAQWYGLNITEGVPKKAFIPMAKTQLRASRKMATIADEITVTTGAGKVIQAPLWFQAYEMTPVETSDGSNDWFIWNVEPGVPFTDLYKGEDFMEMMRLCGAFFKSCRDGDVKGDVGDDTAGEMRTVGSGTADGQPSDTARM
jgi:hypothetical protein